MRRNTLDDPVHFEAVYVPVRIKMIITVEGHLVQALGGIRVWVAERPAVVTALTYPRELLGWMVIHIGRDDQAIITASIVVRISDIVPIVDHYPKILRARHERQPLGVTQSLSKQSPVGAVCIVLIDSPADRIAQGVFHTGIAGRGNRHIQFVIGIERDIFEFVAIVALKLWRAA